MTISVIIPAYNEEKYLPLTLTSLRKLSRKPDQIVVVDGSSTDNTVRLARKYGAEVIVVAHKGIGYARQRGLQYAKGDIVAFTDADTIVPQNWLTVVEETLKEPGVSCVFGSFRVLDGWWLYRMYVNRLQPILNRMFFLFGIPMAPGQNIAFYRTLAMQVGGFPTNYKICEDIEIARRLKTVGKLRMRNDCIVISSGRRGNEGPRMFGRVFKAFFYYFVFRKANIIGFPDQR